MGAFTSRSSIILFINPERPGRFLSLFSRTSLLFLWYRSWGGGNLLPPPHTNLTYQGCFAITFIQPALKLNTDVSCFAKILTYFTHFFNNDFNLFILLFYLTRLDISSYDRWRLPLDNDANVNRNNSLFRAKHT